MKRLLIEEDDSNDPPAGSRTRHITSKIVLFVIYPTCAIFSTVSIITAGWKNGLGSFYTWHVLLSGIGFHLLMPTGISVLCEQHCFRHSSRISSRRTIHWILQSVASVCVLAGTVLQYINREMKHKQHIVSVHSIVGLLSVVLVIVSLVSGVGALFGWELRKYIKPLWLHRAHRSIGVVAFLAGMVALVFAYDKHIFVDNFGIEVRLVIKIATALTALITSFGILKKIYNLVRESCKVR